MMERLTALWTGGIGVREVLRGADEATSVLEKAVGTEAERGVSWWWWVSARRAFIVDGGVSLSVLVGVGDRCKCNAQCRKPV